ncbi:hypothetical protein HPQ32_16045 [Photobacterium carnosum]|uniref:hypothetical protein n=1 Tax=Photobacterium carnosum TaxID=2023717 RepID=UPI001C9298CB|nr:hypothetical protein [Photobacterium carnosum]MBY3789930.1 hypothetical protein [Photobacterium carnosum]MCD9534985.1 hypothetical protein [Photobacterium carnosum]
MYLLLIIMFFIICYLLLEVSRLKKTLNNNSKITTKIDQDSEPLIISEPTEKQQEPLATSESTEAFFVSNEAKIIFTLLYTENDTRAELLGITEDMYESIKLARSWRSNIIKQIHPDKCKYPEAAVAASKVNAIYSRMKKYAK